MSRSLLPLALLLGLAVALALPVDADDATPPGARETGRLQDPQLNESSGLAASGLVPGALWTHNDSGDGPRLWLLDPTGATRAIVTLEGAEARDWEDMASFARGEERWLVVADTGDNRSVRESVTLYLLPEPRLPEGPGPHQLTVAPARRITLRYADGAHDCEGIAVDTSDPDGCVAWLITKERGAGVRARAYRVPLFGDDAGVLTVTHAAELDQPGLTTAADLSSDGRRLVVLTYQDAWLYERAGDERWPVAMARAPRRLAMPRRQQGESICFDLQGRALHLSSEGEGTPLWEVALEPAPVGKRWF